MQQEKNLQFDFRDSSVLKLSNRIYWQGVQRQVNQ